MRAESRTHRVSCYEMSLLYLNYWNIYPVLEMSLQKGWKKRLDTVKILALWDCKWPWSNLFFPLSISVFLLFPCLCFQPLSFLAFWKYKILSKVKYIFNPYIKIWLWLCMGCRPHCVQLTPHYMLIHSALKSLVGAGQNKQSKILTT